MHNNLCFYPGRKKMKKKLIIITLIIVALYTQTSFAFLGFGKATINGFVKNHFGKPIQGVEVKIKNSRFISTTDKFGLNTGSR